MFFLFNVTLPQAQRWLAAPLQWNETPLRRLTCWGQVSPAPVIICWRPCTLISYRHIVSHRMFSFICICTNSWFKNTENALKENQPRPIHKFVHSTCDHEDSHINLQQILWGCVVLHSCVNQILDYMLNTKDKDWQLILNTAATLKDGYISIQDFLYN